MPVAKAQDKKNSTSTRQEILKILVGQTAAVDHIVPYVNMYFSGIAPAGRPAGVFMLLGPTGTGKTKTVEALAQVLHGNDKCMLKIDCGEFQMEHEVAKLIGAPPGYLGHRETQPLLSQQKINSVITDNCRLSLLLFDEIEKASGSFQRMLLGVLDKAVLRLGDNAVVNFENTMIFMTSNLGAKEIKSLMSQKYGLGGAPQVTAATGFERLTKAGDAAAKRRFSPEFINRVDRLVTYHPLDRSAMLEILNLELEQLQQHLDWRLGASSFNIRCSAAAGEWLLDHGTSGEYGARELKRLLLREVVQPLSALLMDEKIKPTKTVRIVCDDNKLSLQL